MAKRRSDDSSDLAKLDFERESIIIIETNVDDVSGEVLSRAVERILESGAYDCTVMPLVGKKGRPGFNVRVVCPESLSGTLATILVAETGTMGVKIIRAERWRARRDVLQIPFRFSNFKGEVTTKLVRTKTGIVRIKPEIEQIKSISKVTGTSMRQIEEEFKVAAYHFLKISEGYE